MGELLRIAANKVTGYANKGLGKESDIHGQDGSRVAGTRDESYAEAERQAGRAVTGYVNKALAPKNPVHGEDGSRPVSEPDQTTGKLIQAIFRNLDNETVGRAIQEYNEAEGHTYDARHGGRQACSFEKGMKMAPRSQNRLLPLRVLAGRNGLWRYRRRLEIPESRAGHVKNIPVANGRHETHNHRQDR